MRYAIGAAVLALCYMPAAKAELNTQDRAALKKMIEGALYLRNNVPCRLYSGNYGMRTELATEVSPTGVEWDKNLKLIEEKQRGKKLVRRVHNFIYWGFGPNDPVQFGKLDFKGDGAVELWVEGVKPKEYELGIRFVGISGLEDFQKAFDHVLSRTPLQDAHPQWPAAIRTAIRERRVVEEMTKEQAFAVVGTPLKVEASEEGGKKVETWHPRQDTCGSDMGVRQAPNDKTGFPAVLRFVDGKLAAIGQAAEPVKVP